jgi:hypothetical protein
MISLGSLWFRVYCYWIRFYFSTKGDKLWSSMKRRSHHHVHRIAKLILMDRVENKV